MQIWDHVEFDLNTHFLPALINGDTSGLSEEEDRALDRWQLSALANHVPDNAVTWHFTHDGDGTYIARDAVQWQMAQCCRVLLYWSTED
jgi:hypothetical protein